MMNTLFNSISICTCDYGDVRYQDSWFWTNASIQLVHRIIEKKRTNERLSNEWIVYHRMHKAVFNTAHDAIEHLNVLMSIKKGE